MLSRPTNAATSPRAPSRARSPHCTLTHTGSVAILLLASNDAICGPNAGLTSGVNGQACTPAASFNVTSFRLFNGSSCEMVKGLSTEFYNVQTAACQSALTEYRNTTEFTCSCKGPYAFLAGGSRPSNVLTASTVVVNLLIALVLPLVGVWIDRGERSKKVFYVSAMLTGLTTGLGSILGPGYIWAIGLTTTMFTAIFYEFSFVGIAPYLPGK